MQVPRNSGGHIVILAGLLAATATAQVAPVTALSPSVLQGATGVTIDTGGLGSARITYAGSSGFLFMEFPTPSLPVMPCASGGGTCLAPVDVRVRHTLNGFRQVSILVDQRCQGPTGFGSFVSSDNFTCLVNPRLDAQNQVSVAALVTLQRNVGDPTVTFNILYNWQVTLQQFCPTADARSARAAGECEEIAIDHIQVVQGVQTTTNSAVLIEGRRAFVRVFLSHSGPGRDAITGDMVIKATANGVPLYRDVANVVEIPFQPPLPQYSRTIDDRGIVSHSAIFVLEPEQAKGSVTINATVQLLDDDLAPTGETKTANPTTVQFVPSNWPAPFRVGRIPLCLERTILGNAILDCPGDRDPFGNLFGDLVQEYMPVREAKIVTVPLPRYTIPESALNDEETMLQVLQVLVLEYLKVQEFTSTFGIGFDVPDHLIFDLPHLSSAKQAEDFFSEGGLGNVWLVQGANFRNVIHGIGHNVGIPHYLTPQEASQRFPNVRPSGAHQWSSTVQPDREIDGVDYDDSANVARSIMSERPYGGISDGEWNLFHQRGPGAPPPPADAPRGAGEFGDVLVISGSIGSDGIAGKLDDGYRGPAAVAPKVSDPNGDTCLRFTGGAGSQYCFKVKMGSRNGYFAVAAPFPAGTTSVTLVRGGRDLTTLQTGAPPQVTIVTPTGGETWQGTQKVRWTSSGAKVFTVQYSPDNGTTWLALSPNVTGSEYEFDTASIIGGQQVRFRVIASAGIDNATATSPAIQVPQTAQLDLGSTSLPFGNLLPGQSAERSLQIRNTGSGQLLVNVTAPDDPAFTVKGDTTILLASNQTANVTVAFRPSAAGAAQAELRIGNQTVALQGNGVSTDSPSIEVAAPADLGQVESGNTKTANVRVRNSGLEKLIIQSLAVSGAGFSLVGPSTPQTIRSGGGIDVQVRVTATSGTMNGQLTIGSNDPSRGQLQVPLTVTVVSGGVPSATAAGVLNAASFQGGSVAPGEIVTIFGENIGPANLATLELLPNGTVSTFVAQTRVFFDGVPAPIVYALAGQTSVIVPYSIGDSAFTEMVIEYQGRRSDPISLRVARTAPALFSANASGSGPGAILNRDGTLNTAQNPTQRGDFIVLFGTGEGATAPLVADGSVTPGIVLPVFPVSVTIGGVAQKVLYAGAAPGLVAGVLQVNVEIAANTPTGVQPIVVSVGGIPSQSGLTVVIAGPATPQPTISLQPTSLDFGTVSVGQTRDLTVEVRNTGNATLTVNSVTSSNGRYTLAQPSAPFNVGPGSFQNATIRFSPNAAGAQSGTVTFTGNASATLNVSGTGQGAPAPNLVFNPISLDFGSVAVGQTRDLVMRFSNTGTGSLNVTALNSSSPMFSAPLLSGAFGVGPGSFQDGLIRFAPTSAGPQTATMTVVSNDPAKPNATFTMTGIGTGAAQAPAIALDPTSLAFGDVAVGQTKDLTVVVRNNGNATLTVTSITSSNGRFALTQPATPFNVGAGSFQNAVIRFSPTAAGAQNGVLTFASNDPVNPSRTVTVTGTGTGGGGTIACPPVGTNLIGNASFEQPGNAGSFTQLNAGATTLNCWTIAAGSIDYIGTAWTASNGSFSIDMDGTSPGRLTQTFATTPGMSYTVAFDMAGNPNGAPAVKQLRVSAAGQSSTRTFDTTGRSVGNMGWTRQTFTFTANAATTTLEFASLSAGGSAGGAAIDNICVEAGAQGCGTGGGGGGGAGNTVLTFNITGFGGGNVPQTYGDNVTATVMGNFTYGGQPASPNVTVQYLSKLTGAGSDLQLWNSTGYGDLVNVVFNDPDGDTGFRIVLTAAGGNAVTLNSFDVGAYGPLTLPGIQVLDANGAVLFNRTNIAMTTTGHQTFTGSWTSTTITIAINTTGLGDSTDNVGLDNISFGQTTGGGGGGGGETPITLASALGIPNRTADNVPAQAIDGNLATFTWTTPSFNSQQPSYLAVGLSAPASVSRLRIYKDNDNGGPGFFPKNLLIQYTTSDPSIPLGSRVWQNVSGLTNGFNGTELLTATAVNADGTVLADNHVSQTSGWASLTFNAVTVTGIRVGFSSVTPICCIHYRVYELQLYGSGGTGGGGGVPEGQIPIAPNTTAPGTLTTSSARSTGCPNCFANVYRLTVDTPQFIVIRLNSTAFDAYLQLLDLSGNILAADDDGNGGTNARISGTFQPGTYLIEATTALEGQTGAYVLALNPN